MRGDSSTPCCYVWLRPPPMVRDALDAHRRQWAWPRGHHLPAAHRLHITLHVLGPLDDGQAADVARALSSVRLPAFDMALDWSGVWTHNGVAVACPAPGAALVQLHDGLGRALGLAPASSAWRPHVTLGRRAQGAGAALLPPVHWPVRDFLFVRSWLPPHDVRHEELGRYALRESEACVQEGVEPSPNTKAQPSAPVAPISPDAPASPAEPQTPSIPPVTAHPVHRTR